MPGRHRRRDRQGTRRRHHAMGRRALASEGPEIRAAARDRDRSGLLAGRGGRGHRRDQPRAGRGRRRAGRGRIRGARRGHGHAHRARSGNPGHSCRRSATTLPSSATSMPARSTQAFADSDEVVEADFVFGRHTGVTLEPRSVVADWNAAEARLTIYQGTQAPHMVQNIAALHLGLAGRPGSRGLQGCRRLLRHQGSHLCRRDGDLCAVETAAPADQVRRRPASRASTPTSMPATIGARAGSASSATAPSRRSRSTISPASVRIRCIRAPARSKPTRSSISSAGPIRRKNYRARARVVFQNKNVMCQYRAVGHPDRVLGDGRPGRSGGDEDRHGPGGDPPAQSDSPTTPIPARRLPACKFELLSHHASLNKLHDDDELRRAARRAGGIAQARTSIAASALPASSRSPIPSAAFYGVGGAQDLVAGRRRGAAGRAGVGDLPDQHHRAGAGLGIAHRADRRQRARRLDGAGARHSRRYRQHALWRRHLGFARRRHRRRGGAAGREGAAREHPRRRRRDPAVHAGRARHRQRCGRQCRRRRDRASSCANSRASSISAPTRCRRAFSRN